MRVSRSFVTISTMLAAAIVAGSVIVGFLNETALWITYFVAAVVLIADMSLNVRSILTSDER